MHLQGQDRRAIADEGLHGQPIAVACPAHGLQAEERQVFGASCIFQHGTFGGIAAGQNKHENDTDPAHFTMVTLA